VYKIIMPLRRKAGMSVEAFRDYYETYHRRIGEKYLAGYATRYMRRFTDALPDADGNVRDPDFDVLLEIWFPDAETFQACGATFVTPEAEKEIREDEEQLFDRSHMPTYALYECESDLPPVKS
jgi:hypothetical protein